MSKQVERAGDTLFIRTREDYLTARKIIIRRKGLRAKAFYPCVRVENQEEAYNTGYKDGYKRAINDLEYMIKNVIQNLENLNYRVEAKEKKELIMNKINNLKQTVELMSSEDYKERFIAEYAQLKIRCLRLERVLNCVSDKTSPDCFKPTCPIEKLAIQLSYMKDYLSILDERAFIEGVDLPEVEI